MPDVLKERDDLLEVQRRIAEGEQLVAEQIARIERLDQQNKDAALAKRLLSMLQAALVRWHEHRHQK